MTETLTGAPARNYVGGEWRESATGETYEKRSPWRPSEVTGVYPASDAEDARAAIEAAREAFPGVVGASRRPAGRLLHEGGSGDRGARRAGRAGHDRRDGQADARGATGDAAGARRSCATRPARPGGRSARCTSRRSPTSGLHAASPARRRRRSSRPGTSRSRSRSGSSPRRSSTATRSSSSSATRRREPGSTSRSASPRPGCPPGVLNVAHRLRLEGRRGDRLEPGRAGDLVHGLGPGRDARCATRRRRATAASSSSSADTTR